MTFSQFSSSGASVFFGFAAGFFAGSAGFSSFLIGFSVGLVDSAGLIGVIFSAGFGAQLELYLSLSQLAFLSAENYYS